MAKDKQRNLILALVSQVWPASAAGWADVKSMGRIATIEE